MSGRRARQTRRERPSKVKAYNLVGGARFHDKTDLLDPANVLQELARRPDITGPLIADTTIKQRDGRPRQDGSWALIMFAFLLSGLVEYKTFADRWASSEVWQIAGFQRAPRKSLVWLRLTELEPYAPVFERAAQQLIARAKRHNAYIGRHIHVDGTAFITFAKAVHDCPDREECRGRKMRAPAELVRATPAEADAARHDEAGTPEDEAGSQEPGITWLALDDPRLTGHPAEKRRRYRWFMQRGHLFRVADTTAGARLVIGSGAGRPKFHFGGQLMLAVDDLFQAPLAVLSQPADVQEFRNYDSIYTNATAGPGEDPFTIVIDRGLHVRAVFEHNLRHRVSTVCEWRQPYRGIWPESLECAEFDRHGVPRCRHCGDQCHTDGAGLGLFLDQHGSPFLRVRCCSQLEPECSTDQRVPCALEPRLLQPVNRTTPLFWDLYQSHKNKEGMFGTLRSRYRVGGRTLGDCIKRRQCVPAQQLRAAAGMFLDWFRICVMHGYLRRPPRKHDSNTIPVGAKERGSGRGLLRTILDIRECAALDVPYGPAAHRTGWAPDDSIPAQRDGPS